METPKKTYISGGNILSLKNKKKPAQKKAFLIFQEMKLSSHKLRKNSYISGGNFKSPKLNKLFYIFSYCFLYIFHNKNLYSKNY